MRGQTASLVRRAPCRQGKASGGFLHAHRQFAVVHLGNNQRFAGRIFQLQINIRAIDQYFVRADFYVVDNAAYHDLPVARWVEFVAQLTIDLTRAVCIGTGHEAGNSSQLTKQFG